MVVVIVIHSDILSCRVVLHFIDRDGDKIDAIATVGDSLLDVAIKNDIEVEGIYLKHLFIYFTFCVVFYRVNLTFLLANGSKVDTKAKVGDNLLDTVRENDIPIDGFGQ
jgi:ferredoxin